MVSDGMDNFLRYMRESRVVLRPRESPIDGGTVCVALHRDVRRRRSRDSADGVMLGWRVKIGSVRKFCECGLQSTQGMYHVSTLAFFRLSTLICPGAPSTRSASHRIISLNKT